MTTPSSNYTLPQISDGGCIDDTWTAISGQPDARHSHTAVWTGNEMIIWGGEVFNFIFFSTGGRYNPGTDSWTPTSGVNAPTARSAHTAVWTGTEMIVWGGYDGTTDLERGADTTRTRTVGHLLALPCALWEKGAHGGLDWQRDDRLGWLS